MLHGVQFIKTVSLAVDGDHLGSGNFNIMTLNWHTTGRSRDEARREPGSNHSPHRSQRLLPFISLLHHRILI